MFRSLSLSWHFVKNSYSVLWSCKRLLLFPVLSTVAALLVTASFLLPLWQSGTLEAWTSAGEDAESSSKPMMYITAFLFYLCEYFVIVFFNAALIASAIQVMEKGTSTVGYGISVALKRLPQIFGWALISAVIGVLLRIIENSNKKAGAIVAAILGTAWTAMTYFVVPVIAMDGVGPIQAFKRSLGILKKQWGTALVGSFSLGLLGFLLMIPVFVLAALLIVLAVGAGPVGAVVGIGLAVILVGLAVAWIAAADVVFKGLLFSYATGRTLPTSVDTVEFPSAFVSRKK